MVIQTKIRWNIYIAAGLTRQGWERRPEQIRGALERRVA
jgi:hypothetical protein